MSTTAINKTQNFFASFFQQYEKADTFSDLQDTLQSILAGSSVEEILQNADDLGIKVIRPLDGMSLSYNSLKKGTLLFLENSNADSAIGLITMSPNNSNAKIRIVCFSSFSKNIAIEKTASELTSLINENSLPMALATKGAISIGEVVKVSKAAKNLDCVVRFRTQDTYKGEYGFCDDFDKRNLINNADSVTFNTYFDTVFLSSKDGKITEEYIIPWLSLYKDSTADMELEIAMSPQKLALFNPTSNDFTLTFEFEASNLSVTQSGVIAKEKNQKISLSIKALKMFNQNQIITVKMGSDIVGKLKVCKNDITYKTKVLYGYVSFNGNGETTILKSRIDLIQLNTILNMESLNQALLRADIEAIPFEWEIDLNSPDVKIAQLKADYFILKGTKWEGKPSFTKAEVGKFLDDIYALFFAHPIYAQTLADVEPNVIIFLTDALLKENNAGEVITYHGIADTGGSACMIFREGYYTASIAHEVLHTMGLQHSWENSLSNPFTFRQNSTKNFLDYTPVGRNRLWKWQWDTIHNDLGVKPE